MLWSQMNVVSNEWSPVNGLTLMIPNELVSIAMEPCNPYQQNYAFKLRSTVFKTSQPDFFHDVCA